MRACLREGRSDEALQSLIGVVPDSIEDGEAFGAEHEDEGAGCWGESRTSVWKKEAQRSQRFIENSLRVDGLDTALALLELNFVRKAILTDYKK